MFDLSGLEKTAGASSCLTKRAWEDDEDMEANGLSRGAILKHYNAQGHPVKGRGNHKYGGTETDDEDSLMSVEKTTATAAMAASRMSMAYKAEITTLQEECERTRLGMEKLQKELAAMRTATPKDIGNGDINSALPAG